MKDDKLYLIHQARPHPADRRGVSFLTRRVQVGQVGPHDARGGMLRAQPRLEDTQRPVQVAPQRCRS
jgi:hypothetical protein